MSLQDNIKIGKQIYQFFNENKIDELVNLFSDRATEFHVPTNLKFTGREGFRQATEIWKNAFTDARCNVKNQIVTEDYIVTEFDGIGTHNGNLVTPMGTLNPTGHEVNLPCLEIFKIKDGLIEDYKLYFDTATLMHQIGVVAEKA